MLSKKKKEIAKSLEVLNGAVWDNSGSEQFPDYVKAICSICVACKLDVNSVMVNSARAKTAEVKQPVAKRQTKASVK